MPLRDLIVVGLFALGAYYTLKRPYFGALLWIWIGVMNPHRLGWGFAYSLPLAMLAALITLVSILFNSKQVRWPGGTPLTLMMLLMLWMSITTATAIDFDISFERFIFVLKVFFMTFIVALLIRTREEILGTIWVIVMSLGYFGIKGGLFTIFTGGSYRVWGPADSQIAGNNELAVALIFTLPLMYFLAQETAIVSRLPLLKIFGEKWIKRGLYFGMLMCAAAAMGSHSRGALLAITAMTLMLWWRSKSKLYLGFVILLAIPIGLMSMPDAWFERMNTISTYEEDASAMGRINAWQTAINIANDRITGGGFIMSTQQIYTLYSPNPSEVLVAHSIYFQILGEHGYPGLILYLLFWLTTYATAGALARNAERIPEMQWCVTLGRMAQVSILGLAVGGTFLNLAYWDVPYYLMVILIASRRLVQAELDRIASVVAPAKAKGFAPRQPMKGQRTPKQSKFEMRQ